MVLLLLVCLAPTVVEAKKKMKHTDAMDTASGMPESKQDTSGDFKVPFLIDTLGKEIYRELAAMTSRPKYKFYIYMTLGKLPEEQTFVAALNVICNFLYCTAIMLGFLFLPRGYMLFGTILTLFVGPALILVLLGSMGLMAAAFCLYPVMSVVSMWLIFFLMSRAFQVLGRRLGLDHDKDGDVDLLDFLHYAAETSWGKLIGLPKLHDTLNKASMDPFQEINRRLDKILEDEKGPSNNHRKSD